MLAKTMKYLADQIAIYENIQSSFPKLEMGDYSIGSDVHKLFCTVRDTLSLLRMLLVEAKEADSYDDFKAIMDEMDAEYRDRAKKAADWAEYLKNRRDMGYISAKINAEAAQLPVNVIGSVHSGLRQMEYADLME